MRNFLVKIYLIVRSIIRRLGLLRFAIVGKICAVIIRNLKRDFAVVDGHPMFLDKNDSLALSIEKFEPTSTGVFKKHVKSGDVVVDLGAHIGYYTLLAARLVGPSGKVFVFEPNLENFRLLQKNVEANGCKNVILNNLAVAESNRKARLYLSGRAGDHRIYDSNDDRPSVEVDVVALDSYLDGQGKIDFIKMDIQGTELAALMGMRNLLLNNPDIEILMEYQTNLLKKFGANPAALVDFLTSHKFNIYKIGEKKHTIKLADPEELKKSDFSLNLFCTKQKLQCLR